MTKEFEMSMVGKLKYFLGSEIHQWREGTFLCQAKYIQDMLKKFEMTNVKPYKFPMDTKAYLHLDLDGKEVDKNFIDLLLGLCFTFVHLDQALCLVWVCVQDSNQVQ